MVESALRIGQVAARAAVSVQTLRCYERRGLLAGTRSVRRRAFASTRRRPFGSRDS